jgi:small-conductance mechanosensitive channel
MTPCRARHARRVTPPVRVALALVWLVVAGAACAADVDGTAAAIRPDHQAQDLGKLLDLARERGQEVVVRIQPAAAGAAAASAAAPSQPTPSEPRAGASLLGSVRDLADGFSAGLDAGAQGILALPRFTHTFAQSWQGMRNAASSLDALVRLAAVAGGALLAAVLVRVLAGALPRRAHPDDFRGRLGAALVGGFYDALAAAAFAWVGAALLERLLPEPDLVRRIARDINHGVVWLALYWIGARFLLAPNRPDWRLLPIRRAAWHYRIILSIGLIGLFIYVTVDTIETVGDASALAGWALLTTSTVLVIKLWWFWHGRSDFAELARVADRGLLVRAMGVAVAWILIVAALAAWMLGRYAAVVPEGVWWNLAAGLTQLAVLVVPVVAIGADVLIAELLHAEGADATPMHKALVAVGRALASGAVWLIGFLVLADVWGLYVATPGSTAAQAALRDALTVGVTLVVGWTVWRFVAVYLAAHAPKPRAAVPGAEDEPELVAESRLATALPLVRGLVEGSVIGVTALIVLSTLGLNIGPLLAGFGVIGLAISFGSQALVRDIVSGIFFMADDAFRVGEYIDTGRLKGTVEKITLRSVQLRHQSGLVHTIPFGQIQSVTNASRDWATVKFNIRLEHGIDLERTRKIIKKVGQEMLTDEELAPEIILPLKLQGVADVTETALVLRLKVTAKPDRASWVQREALKRTYAALEANNIDFSRGAVTVRAPDPASAAANAAAAGAATLRGPREVAG